ncbi:reprolysin-like metallopeptidase [Polaribacter sp. IC073]|uniref:reprolysin-like metallopeptidase n=1 Tax=Polaribacter sp. IC073 TaxID=2508540 RepID=UPI001CB904B4|nr:zinc-dependent metalloprotease family protein [Polaribacter sp. IC073]
MKIKQLQLSVLAVLLLFSLKSNSQELWKKLNKETYSSQKKEVRSFKNFPTKHLLYQLDLKEVKNTVNIRSKSSGKTILLPNSEGVLETFEIKEASNFEKGLSDKFPSIKSYTAVGIDTPTSYAKISMGSDGFHAVIFSTNGKTVYIDPYSKDNREYIVYKTSDLKEEDAIFKCKVEASAKEPALTNLNARRTVNDGNLRTFRLALVCSGEYAQFHLTNQGISTTASDTEKKTAVLSAMNTSMTRVNGLFEKDLAVKMVLVADNDNVIFLDKETDNITDGDPGAMIDEVQTIADAQIGTANYDIGHVFSLDGDGLAGLGVVCVTGQKARGVTGRSAPIGDPYDIDFVAHEMGHQFGATHTQNSDCNRSNNTSVEPGSASTIMGYAGICSPNVQGKSDAYFHAVSISQMQAIIASSASCAALTSNGNSTPVADAGFNYSIPKSTPFILKGTATDADGLSSLTYNWEQTDNEVATMPPVATSTGGPMFRSLPSNISSNRYMPELATVVSGNTSSTWEVLPSVARDLSFSFLVRDNNTSGGATSRDNMIVTVEDAVAFTVTSQTTTTTWDAGSSQTITWNKGTTDIAPINCQNVTIKLSEDGGLTFPITLISNTLNDGTETITVPNNVTAQARIMVVAADNIFYNVNRVNFEIQSTIPSFIITNTSGDLSACNSENQSVRYTLNLDFINGFTEAVSFVATGQPVGSLVNFSPTTMNSDGNVVLTISNLDGTTAKDYNINIQGNSASVNQNIDVKLGITASNLGTVTLTAPSNGATDVSLTEVLTWQEDTNASSYIVEIANDSAFTNIVATGLPTTNAYEVTNLDINTLYYWRVKAKNNCNEGSFSNSFNFTTEISQYCTSTFTDEAGGSEHITNVTFNSINNTSGNDTVDGYQDFTTINTSVLRGQTREISVTLNTGGFQDHCYVFIDWNQDYVFDKNTERYDLGSKLEDIDIATFNIKVPSDAKFGKTRMRVLIEYEDPTDGSGDGACDADHLTEWGETEDYSITIVEPTLKADNYTINVVNETTLNTQDGEINIGIKQDEFSYQVTVVGPSINIDDSFLGRNIYSLKALASGKYTICIKALEIDSTQCFELDIEPGLVIVAPDNYTIKTSSETCVDQDDGRINIAVKKQQYTYQLKITGPSTNIDESLVGFSYLLSDLSPGDYQICIEVKESNQTNCFEVEIVASQPISLKASVDKTSKKYSFQIDEGTAPFSVFLNNKLLQTSNENNFEIELKEGGKLEVKTAKDCEGVYKTTIDAVLLLKNPVVNSIELLLPLGTENSKMETVIFDINGKLVFKKMVNVDGNTMSIPFQNFAKGIYILKLPITAKPIKILKK